MRSFILLLSLIFVPLAAETPSVEAQEAAAEFVHELAAIMKDSRQIVATEAPAVFQEILMQPWMLLGQAVIGLLASITTFYLAIKLSKKYGSFDENAPLHKFLSSFLSLAFTIIVSVVFFIMLCSSTSDCIKATYTPRAFIIDYLRPTK